MYRLTQMHTHTQDTEREKERADTYIDCYGIDLTKNVTICALRLRPLEPLCL